MLSLPVLLRLLLEGLCGLSLGVDCPLPSLENDEEPISDKHAENLRSGARDRRKHLRRGYYLSTIIIKHTLPDSYRAPHDFKLAQVLKSLGCTAAVIDFLKEQGLCLSNSQMYKREARVAESIRDEELLPPPRDGPWAIAWDNNDHKQTISAIGGRPNLPTIACTGVGVEDKGGILPRLASEKEFTPLDQLSVDDILGGLPRDDDAKSYESFFAILRKAVWACGLQSHGGDNPLTCLEIQMRKVRRAPSSSYPYLVSDCVILGEGEVVENRKVR